jgi:hypothetical protein
MTDIQNDVKAIISKILYERLVDEPAVYSAVDIF